MAPKEVALTRMLMATSVLFVLCLAPTLLVQLATFLVSELRYNGRYHNLVVVLWALVSLCKVLNSSLNFFVYYAMGSRSGRLLWCGVVAWWSWLVGLTGWMLGLLAILVCAVPESRLVGRAQCGCLVV